MNTTQLTILRALAVACVLDEEHTSEELHASFRAVRHELRALRDIHCPRAKEQSPELKSASKGRGTRPGSQRHLILGALAREAQADFQLARHLGVDVAVVRKRRHELLAASWVQRTRGAAPVAKAHNSASGRECQIYEITPAGRTALHRLESGQVALFTEDELGNDSVTTPDNAKGCDVSPT